MSIYWWRFCCSASGFIKSGESTVPTVNHGRTLMADGPLDTPQAMLFSKWSFITFIFGPLFRLCTILFIFTKLFVFGEPFLQPDSKIAAKYWRFKRQADLTLEKVCFIWWHYCCQHSIGTVVRCTQYYATPEFQIFTQMWLSYKGPPLEVHYLVIFILYDLLVYKLFWRILSLHVSCRETILSAVKYLADVLKSWVGHFPHLALTWHVVWYGIYSDRLFTDSWSQDGWLIKLNNGAHLVLIKNIQNIVKNQPNKLH